MQLVQRKKIDELVYEQLLANIRDGAWQGGEKIPSEPELCEMLGVSRVSVRSAIQRLCTIGLLEARQGRGTFVTLPGDMLSFSDFGSTLDLTEKEFNDITALREALEPVAIELVLARGDDVDLGPIEAAYVAMQKALVDLEYEEYTRQDYQFHTSIIIASGNDLFVQIATIFRDQYFKYLKELNKFMFDDSQASAALVRNALGPSDSHTLVYEHLMRKNNISPVTLVTTCTSGNKKNFERYLRERRQQAS